MKRQTRTSRHPDDILSRARRGGYAIGAFNVSSHTVLKAIVQAAHRLRSPVIIETSSGETAFMGAEVQAAVLALYERQYNIPILINLDHAKSYREVKIAMDAGYEMVHFDGSELPRASNIRILKRVVREAHRRQLLVEGELDHITGSSEWHRGMRMERELGKGSLTDPDAAVSFVRASGIDVFAPFIGNVHGVFQNRERLNFALLQELADRLPCFLSLHGGSGIRRDHVRRAISLGISKINVNTELRIAYVTTLRKVLATQKNEIAPYKLMPPVIAAVQKVVEEKIRLFGSVGKA
ncbi:MAG: class II fructose-bisphosphate aldolase [Candidatus Kerfeldbacteria bacterium]|nr:class II fructose-bisphosphate aldolase [Candidatus Kerfeldbacteria bacterium]